MAHVVMLPLSRESHHKPMLTIAELLCHNGLRVTFLNNINDGGNNDQLLQSATNSDLHQRLRVMPITSQVKRTPGVIIFEELVTNGPVYKQEFKDIMVSLGQEDGGGGGWPRPTCVIADWFLSFAVEVAEELNIPLVAYGPNASVLWTCFHVSKLNELGDVPFFDDNLDKRVTCIAGMETLLRHKDLPTFFICEAEHPEHPISQFIRQVATTIPRASALVLNTFQELEAPIIDQLGSIYSKIYTVGPFQDLVKFVRAKEDPLLPPPNFGSYRQENRTCLTWLDSQLPESVIYASFGSLAPVKYEKLLEIWYGLVNSSQPFMLVVRGDMINDQRDENILLPNLITMGTKERGFVVDWAPQDEVLKHPSVGGFLTHSGWKSTIESISAGVPMICWPQFADQQLNSRCVSDLWRIGLDMKNGCDRWTVEKMIRDLMVNKRDQIMSAVNKYSQMARQCVKEGGSSHESLKMLVEDIKSNNLE